MVLSKEGTWLARRALARQVLALVPKGCLEQSLGAAGGPLAVQDLAWASAEDSAGCAVAELVA